MMYAGEFTATFNAGLGSNENQAAQRRTAQRTRAAYMAAVVARLRDLAPYAAIAVLPGGSLMALVLWLYRRHRRAAFSPAH